MNNPNEFIFCIFSYNRYRYLVNLIDSLQRFYPDNKIAIYDDNSNSTVLLAYYKILRQDSKFSIVNTKFSTKNLKHGGLYEMMNLALRQATIENYTYAFFIQDDLQFIQNINLTDWSRNTFKKWHNALMISPLFFQKIYAPYIDKFIEEKNDDFIFKNYGVADVGIIHLERAKKAALTFDNRGEKYNGHYYYDKGHQMVFSNNPCISWVPWVYSYKNRNKKAFSLKKRGSPFLKYLDKTNRFKLITSKDIPFMEDYTRLNNKWIPKPYIFLNLKLINIVLAYLKYWKYIILIFLTNDKK